MTTLVEAAGALVLFQLFDSLTQGHNLLVLLLLEELQLLWTHARAHTHSLIHTPTHEE